ncbi:hypothetical protein GCM10022225_82080 [Plantactinospora mayteni]|uniref:Uncharacterized protein n=1 Tax=Plantactinospora mayteni TaxID=566021 RepID=A0ABQ4F3Z2_9ACTN|nr:helix-turn-helix domain-containing protein [Plantactinospora mayteni]GIH01613.1 hypothetical protein Pma05_81850 [Plantactinospora mayteni]
MRLRRAIVVLMSAQGQPGPDIGHLLKVPEDDVWDVIHAFNDGGFASARSSRSPSAVQSGLTKR